MDSGSLRSHAHLPIFKKGREHLASRNMRHAFLLLYCPASTQNYHILVYDTDQGIVRLNLYSNQGALTVTETRTLDSALALSQQIRNNF